MRTELRVKRGIAFAAVAFLGSVCAAEGIDPVYMDLALYGIDREGGHLSRFDFSTGLLTDIGHVHDTAGNELDGIEASAYIPGFTNLYGFWLDPSDGQSKIVYINANTAQATVVGSPMGSDQFTGAAAVETTSGWGIYGIQQPLPIGFDITGGEVVPEEDYAVKVTVLGAAFALAGVDQPVTMRVNIGGSAYEPLGVFEGAVSGDLNDGVTHEAVISSMHTAGTGLSVVGRAWKIRDGASGTSDDDWIVSTTVDSTATATEVIVLRDGDPLPPIASFADPVSTADFLEPYIDFSTHTVVLDEGQALFLYELAESGAAGGDFDDLAVLVTLGRTVSDVDGTATTSSDAGRLVKVDHKTGATTEIMTLSRPYYSLASTDGFIFHATGKKGAIYEIDATSGTETLVGSASGVDRMVALEFAGTTAMGFDVVGDELVPLDASSATVLGSPASLGVKDLGTIIFMDADAAEILGHSFD